MRVSRESIQVSHADGTRPADLVDDRHVADARGDQQFLQLTRRKVDCAAGAGRRDELDRFVRLPYARLGVRAVGDQAKPQQQDAPRSPIVMDRIVHDEWGVIPA